VPGVFLLLGPERFLAREAAARLLAAHAGLEVTRFDGEQVQVAQVLDELRTPTLFGEPRGVVVDEAGPLLSGDALVALAEYARAPVPGTLLVLQAASIDRRLKGAKALEGAAETIPCKPPHDREVAGWIGQHGRERYGLSMGRDAAEALRLRVGEDLGLLDQALRRLKEQIAPRTRLAAADVEESTGEHRSPILFEAANAVEARDLPRALTALAGAFDEGIRINQSIVTDAPAVAPILLTNLHKAWTRLLRFHMLAGRGLSPPEAARRAGISPQAQRYFLDRARHHRLDALIERHRHFVAADLALKGGTGGAEARQVLERLLLALLA